MPPQLSPQESEILSDTHSGVLAGGRQMFEQDFNFCQRLLLWGRMIGRERSNRVRIHLHCKTNRKWDKWDLCHSWVEAKDEKLSGRMEREKSQKTRREKGSILHRSSRNPTFPIYHSWLERKSLDVLFESFSVKFYISKTQRLGIFHILHIG